MWAIFIIFSIQNLSLKNCKLSDVGGKYIGEALSDNKTLLTLNLCFNNLTSESVKYLAEVSQQVISQLVGKTDLCTAQKWSFPLKISSLNVTKSAGIFFCAVMGGER